MNFKAHMTLLSWRELLQWMISRGEESAAVLTDTCASLAIAENIDMTHAVEWQSTEPAVKPGVLVITLISHDFIGRALAFEFNIEESNWFSHEPLALEMFKWS